jgi:ABC-2 type transport system ATP-binding protein
MLQFLQVRKEYGERVILSIPGLTLTEGIYWLTGTNGSGKTTLLKIVSGLIPFSGEIILEGVNLRANPVDYRRFMSSAEAEPVFPTYLTGRELIRFHHEIRRGSRTQTDQLVERLGFGQFLSTPVGTYSSGMIKRLSLLLAFIGHTKLILLDEPLATLDAEAAILLPLLMMEYRKAYGTSFIFSSHSSFHDENPIVDHQLLIQDQVIHLIA